MSEMCKESRDKYDVWKYRNSIELQCAPYVGAVNTYKVLQGAFVSPILHYLNSSRPTSFHLNYETTQFAMAATSHNRGLSF